MTGSTANFTAHFLIAMPSMADPHFAHTLFYICEHNEKGALGIVINKPIDIKLRNLFEKVELSLDRKDLAEQPDVPAERYHRGKELRRIEQSGSRVMAHFADGTTAEAEKLVRLSATA